MRVTILGAGAMGSALTIPLCDRGHEIRLWFTEYDEQIYEIVSKNNPHPRIKVKIPSSVSFFRPNQLASALEDTDCIIIAVSSKGVPVISRMIREAVGKLNVPIAIVSKGIEVVDGKAKTMSEIVKEYTRHDRVVYIGGPSLAFELARRLQTHVVYASRYIEDAVKLKESFETNYYRINVTRDVTGVEISAALKNIYAMAYGIIEGYLRRQGLVNNNLKAAILSKSVNEMARIVKLCGGEEVTVYGLAGLGDLYVTSLGGRNSMFGQLLGEGLSVTEALEEMKRRGVGVVEGVKNAKTIHMYIKDRGIKRENAPIFYAIYDILYEGAGIEILLNAVKH